MSNYFVAHACIVGPAEEVQRVHEAVLYLCEGEKAEEFTHDILPLSREGLMAITYDAGESRGYPALCGALRRDNGVKGKSYSLKNLIVLIQYGQESIQESLLTSSVFTAKGNDTAALLAAFQYQCLRQFALDISAWEPVTPHERTYVQALEDVQQARQWLSGMDPSTGLYGRTLGRKPLEALTNSELALEWSFVPPTSLFTLALSDPQSNPNG